MSYKIDEIYWDKTPNDTFTNAKGEDISFMDYYKNQYGIEVLDPKQPLLVSYHYVVISRHISKWKFQQNLICNLITQYPCIQVSRAKKKGLSEGEVDRIICLIPGIIFLKIQFLTKKKNTVVS